jgi:Tfp pilus assembly protein PilF
VPAAAIADLEARIQAGDTTSRNHLALARAYAETGDTTRARAAARHAADRQAQDGQLSDTERCEVGELLRDGN